MAKTSALMNDLCMRAGLGLAIWQHIEDQHYKLFLELLGVNDGDVPSVVYFSTESFDGRRKMVSRMFQLSVTTKEQREEWNDLEKDLKDYNENRNKLAHYTVTIDVYTTTAEDGKLRFKIGDFSYVPSLHNRVSKLLGRTRDKPEHNLTAAAVDDYIRQFNSLTHRLSDFVWNMRLKRLGQQSAGLRPPKPEIDPPPPWSNAS